MDQEFIDEPLGQALAGHARAHHDHLPAVRRRPGLPDCVMHTGSDERDIAAGRLRRPVSDHEHRPAIGTAVEFGLRQGGGPEVV